MAWPYSVMKHRTAYTRGIARLATCVGSSPTRATMKTKKFWIVTYKGVVGALGIENCSGLVFLTREKARIFARSFTNRYVIRKVYIPWSGWKNP